MGHAARANPRSLDGHKAWPWVERARLEVAPLSTLVKAWVRVMVKRTPFSNKLDRAYVDECESWRRNRA